MGRRAGTLAPCRGAASLAALAAILVLAAGQGRTASPETPAIVSEMCDDEHQAVRNYRSFAVKALEEGHPAVAHFFEALASSETVHARNFMEQLRRLQLAPEVKLVEPTVESSRKNLRRASRWSCGRSTPVPRPSRASGVKIRMRRPGRDLGQESEKQHRDHHPAREGHRDALQGAQRAREAGDPPRDLPGLRLDLRPAPEHLRSVNRTLPTIEIPPVYTQRQSAGTSRRLAGVTAGWAAAAYVQPSRTFTAISRWVNGFCMK
jgi:hypothetical protein